MVDEEVPWVDPFPAPDAWGQTTGPGAPSVSFSEDDLFEHCAYLQGDPLRSADHHNLAVMYDGYLIMPWAPEDGVQRADWQACGMTEPPSPEQPGTLATCEGVFGGGISVFDMSEPCAPVKVGEGWSPWMRESHTLAFSTVGDRTYMAVDFLDVDGSGGVGFWDMTDLTAPVWAGQIRVPDHHYPDSYTRLTLSVFWQGPYVYASTATVGVHVIDATDPTQPTLAAFIDVDGPHQVGSFHVFGNLAMSSSAGLNRTVLMDMSDPLVPAPVFGGDFYTTNPQGRPAPYYFANLGSEWALFAHSPAGGGGPLLYDITDPTVPTRVAAATHELGEGGYIFQHEDLLFQGESSFGAVYDIRDPSSPVEVGVFSLEGDLDTVTPVGQIAIVSVDERAAPGQASAVVPWSAEPDTRGPRPGMTSPTDGATFQALTSRIGVVFDEMLEPVSVFEGSFRVSDPEGGKVAGHLQVQENVVNFTPAALLAPSTTYTVTIPAGGIVDVSGNPTEDETVWSFTTGKGG